MVLEDGAALNGEESLDEDIRDVNAAIGASISETLRTMLGPNGMDKMLVDTNGMVLLTNDGKTVLGEMGVNLDLLPAGRLLKNVALEQDDSIGDGTIVAVVIAGELLRNATNLFDQGLHPATIARGYMLATQRAEAVVANAGTDIEPTHTETLKQVIGTAIAGWGGTQEEETLTSLIVKAADELATTGDLRWDRLVVKKIVGGTVADSSLRRGTLFEGEPIHTAMPRLLEPGRVACLNTNLKPNRTSTDLGEVNIRDPDDLDLLLDFEAEDLRSKVEAIAESGANTVFSDKSIDERAGQLLVDRDILAVRRMAESDLRSVARATGATVTDAAVIEPSDIGDASHIVHQDWGDDVFFIATEDTERLSLVLRGGTEQVLNEMERAAQNGFATVRALHQDPRIVPGGGAIEMQTALALREYANGVGSREQFAIIAFADALETIPRSLAESSGLNPVDALSEIRRRHAAGDDTTGVRATEGHVDDVLAAGIVDPIHVKQRSIASATDVVSRIVRIDGVLDAK